MLRQLYRQRLISTGLRKNFSSVSNKVFAVAASNHVTLETNKKTETNRLEKTLQKFWEKITVEEEGDSKVVIKLDNKPLRTPLGYSIAFPKSKKLLAELIALEWRNLPNLSIKPHQLPLTSITARAVDLNVAENDEDAKAKLGNRQHVNEEMLRYLDTDTLLIFSPLDEHEGRLREEQDKLYKPIMTKVENYLSRFHPENEQIKLSFLDSEIHGIRSNRQSSSTRLAAKNFMNSLNIYEFVAFEKAVMSSKSFICGIYTIKLLNKSETEMKLELDDIIRASRLETIYQTDQWGEVDDTHDVEKEEIRKNLTSAVLLAYN